VPRRCPRGAVEDASLGCANVDETRSTAFERDLFAMKARCDHEARALGDYFDLMVMEVWAGICVGRGACHIRMSRYRRCPAADGRGGRALGSAGVRKPNRSVGSAIRNPSLSSRYTAEAPDRIVRHLDRCGTPPWGMNGPFAGNRFVWTPRGDEAVIRIRPYTLGP